jgi:multiple sugar transport system permease protein
VSVRASSSARLPRSRANSPFMLALAPAGFLIVVFTIVPVIWAAYISLTPMTLLGPDAGSTRFEGLDNYQQILEDPAMGQVLRNTLLVVLGAGAIGAAGGGLAVALLIDYAADRGSRLAGVAFLTVLAAGICPPPLAGGIWGGIFDYRRGVLGAALERIGLARIDMLGEFPLLSLIIAETWRGVAIATLVYTGALRSIPQVYYEAARIEGVSWWDRFNGITFPAIRPVLGLVLILTTMLALGSFLLDQALTRGGTGRQSETLAFYAYTLAFGELRIGFGAAISMMMLGFALALALVLGAVTLRTRVSR